MRFRDNCLRFRLLGKEAVTVGPELQVVKVSTGGPEQYHPRENDLREQTGCAVIAVERGDDLFVEFGADFMFQRDVQHGVRRNHGRSRAHRTHHKRPSQRENVNRSYFSQPFLRSRFESPPDPRHGIPTR